MQASRFTRGPASVSGPAGLDAAAAFFLRVFACVIASHNKRFAAFPGLHLAERSLGGQARKRRAWNPALPLTKLRLGVIQSAAPPAREPLPAWIDVVPGAYTAVVLGKDGAAGVALVEVYDLDPEASSRLANVSTRAFAGTGENIVIAGITLGRHPGDDSVVVRGLGPSLTQAGIVNPLSNPTLELRDRNGTLLMANNDWEDEQAQAAALTAAGLAPSNRLEAGIAATLPPGSYTALLAGLDQGTGIGLVEVYDLP